MSRTRLRLILPPLDSDPIDTAETRVAEQVAALQARHQADVDLATAGGMLIGALGTLLLLAVVLWLRAWGFI